MPVTLTRTADPAGVNASGGNNTYTGVSIGTAATDRIVVVVLSMQSSGANPDLFTIDYGSGALSMTLACGVSGFGSSGTFIYYLAAPTGTTATIVISATGADYTSTTHHISVYTVTGSTGVPTDTATDSTSDMVTDPLSAVITVPVGGAGLAVAADTAETTVSWTGFTEDLDEDAGVFEHSTSTGTTGGDITVTCTGTSATSDGCLAAIAFGGPSAGFFVFF